MDSLSASERSERMARVRGKDTKPELAVRSLLHRLGYRYRLHAKELPGRPDLVFRPRRRAIFVHGCFWHRHEGCKLARMPKSRLEFWEPKLEGNRVRDRTNQKALSDMGWRYLVVWECELGDMKAIEDRLVTFLEGK